MSQRNLELFRAEQNSEEWKAYVEYIDDMVIDGFFNSIDCSLRFFLDNTGRFLIKKDIMMLNCVFGILIYLPKIF